MDLQLANYIFLILSLFLLGISGIYLNRRNVIVMLMSMELMLLSINLLFVVLSMYLDDLVGQLLAILVLTVAAAESAIGLALVVVLYNVRGAIEVQYINLIRG